MQRHRRLPGGARAAACKRVDRGAVAVVRAAAGDAPSPAAAWCIAPKSCSCADRGRTRWWKRAGARTLRGGLEPRRGGEALTPGRVQRVRGSWKRPRRPTATRVAAGASRSPASRCCGSAQGRADPPPRPSVGSPARPARPVERAAMLPAYVEIMLAVGSLDGRARPVASSTKSQTGRERATGRGWRHRPRAPLSSPTGTPGALAPLRQRCGRSRSSRFHTRRRGRGSRRAGMPLARGGGRHRARVGGRAAKVRGNSGPSRIRRGSTRSNGPGRSRYPRADGARDRGATSDRGGKEEQAIAGRLLISEHTVARHVSNILVKVGPSSRSAATAFAYAHQLV